MEHGQGLALPGAERGRNLMNAARWQRVNDLFHSAAERAPEDRAAFLDEACHGDCDLRRRVERLLEAHPHVGAFLEKPLADRHAEDGAAAADLRGETQADESGGAGAIPEFLIPSAKPGALGLAPVVAEDPAVPRSAEKAHECNANPRGCQA